MVCVENKRGPGLPGCRETLHANAMQVFFRRLQNQPGAVEYPRSPPPPQGRHTLLEAKFGSISPAAFRLNSSRRYSPWRWISHAWSDAGICFVDLFAT